MTVIAFDGTTLASDKFAQSFGVTNLTTKIRRINGDLVGISGGIILSQMLFEWAKNGWREEDIPVIQKDPDKYAAIICVKPDKTILLYENSSVPWHNERKLYAIGSGQDLAIGAMAAGADAVQAVKIAIEYNILCGGGVDSLTFEG